MPQELSGKIQDELDEQEEAEKLDEMSEADSLAETARQQYQEKVSGGVPAGATVLEIPQDVPEGILSEKLSQAIKEAVENSGGDNPLGKSRIGVTKSLYKNPADSKKARKLAKKMRATNRRHNSNHRS